MSDYQAYGKAFAKKWYTTPYPNYRAALHPNDGHGSQLIEHALMCDIPTIDTESYYDEFIWHDNTEPMPGLLRSARERKSTPFEIDLGRPLGTKHHG